jgi:hypothetical protein
MSESELQFSLYLICDACRCTLTGEMYECTKCSSIFLCSTCFTLGASFNTHNNTHECRKGRVQGALPVAVAEILAPPLNLNEILLFLSVIQEHGFNWTKVSEMMPFVGRAKLFSVGNCEKIYAALLNTLHKKPCLNIPTVPRPDILAVPGPANYSTLRDEFEHDWLPEAEVFLAEADGVDRELIVKLLHTYNAILDERVTRKRFIVDSGLTAAPNKKRKIILDKLRILARPAALLGPGTLDAVALNLAEEERLRETLSKALVWKKVGAKNEPDYELFAQLHAKQAEAKLKLQHDSSVDPYVYLEEIPTYGQSPYGLFEDELQLCEKVGVSPQHCAVVKRLFQVVKPTTVAEAVALVNPMVVGAHWRARNEVHKPLSATELSELLNIFVQALVNRLFGIRAS